jgi:hypothetical protein
MLAAMAQGDMSSLPQASAAMTEPSTDSTTAPESNPEPVASALPATEPPVTPAPAAEVSLQPVVDMLKAQLQESQTQVIKLSSDLASVQAKFDALGPTQKSLIDIACSAINLCNVRMGRAPANLSHLTPESAVAMYLQVAAEFAATFGTGQHAKNPDDEDETSPPAAVNNANVVKAFKSQLGLQR